MGKITYKRIPNCLRKYRRARGLNQKEVAKSLGLKSASIISRWEKGICLPSTINLFKLAALYRTLVDALFIDLLRFLRQKLIKKEKKSPKANR
jgi:transcriptional regulator with XRE-family HTH domain